MFTDLPETNLTVLIIEDGITDVQLTPDGIVNDYTQSHAFRTMLTNTIGNPIVNLNEESMVGQNFSFSLPADWVAENCTVIAFVHESGASKEVLQVEEETVSF